MNIKMNGNKKLFLMQIIAIFLIALFLIVLINICELSVLKSTLNDVRCVYFAMITKIVVCIVAFAIFILFVLMLFNKEVNYDYMTGLCSRRKLFYDLNLLISSNKNFTVCYIDFNDFKHINDTYGHCSGDVLLKEFANRVKALNPKLITGYRIGGDEFVIIIKENPDVQKCIKLIWSVTEEDVKVTKDFSTKISFAMGIVNNDFASTAEELLKKADSCMYEDKKS